MTDICKNQNRYEGTNSVYNVRKIILTQQSVNFTIENLFLKLKRSRITRKFCIN